MQQEFKRCPKCGKVFSVLEGKAWCAACTAVRAERLELISEAINEGYGEALDDIARYTGLSIREVADLVEQSESLRRLVALPKRCIKCKEKLAQRGSQFCFPCRLALYGQFASAAAHLAAKMPPKEYQPQIPYRSSGVVTALEQKRARASLARLDPTPKGRMER